MKKIEDEHWTHKGCDIYLVGEHPKLYGKYEINWGDTFVARAVSLKEAKTIINNIHQSIKK